MPKKLFFSLGLKCISQTELTGRRELQLSGSVWLLDESNNKKGVDAGVWSEESRKEKLHTLNSDVSVIQSEVYAILACAKLCIGRKLGYISIFSDS